MRSIARADRRRATRRYLYKLSLSLPDKGIPCRTPRSAPIHRGDRKRHPHPGPRHAGRRALVPGRLHAVAALRPADAQAVPVPATGCSLRSLVNLIAFARMSYAWHRVVNHAADDGARARQRRRGPSHAAAGRAGHWRHLSGARLRRSALRAVRAARRQERHGFLRLPDRADGVDLAAGAVRASRGGTVPAASRSPANMDSATRARRCATRAGR